jgi:hypothetical protein
VPVSEIVSSSVLRCAGRVESAATTLCAGWSAHDLAIHLWLIKRELSAWVYGRRSVAAVTIRDE